jgi:DNA repair exonuclease SbcCD ATPase subunit
MAEMYTLEEFPPRREPRHEPEPTGRFRKKRENKEKREKLKEPGNPQPRGGRQGGRQISVSLLPIAAILAIGASTGGAGAFWWAERRVAGLEGALNEARSELQTANSSLSTLWTTTTSLDEANGRRQGFLRDSLASVQEFVDTEVAKLWQTAYLEHRRRLDTDAALIEENDQSIQLLFDASSTTSSRIDALFRENEVQYTNLRDLGQAVEAARQTLAAISNQVGELQTQFAATRVARGQLDRRIGGVERWVDGFTSAGLDGDAVERRLASLVGELAVMTARVDSLRIVTDSVRRSRTLVGLEDRPR